MSPTSSSTPTGGRRRYVDRWIEVTSKHQVGVPDSWPAELPVPPAGTSEQTWSTTIAAGCRAEHDRTAAEHAIAAAAKHLGLLVGERPHVLEDRKVLADGRRRYRVRVLITRPNDWTPPGRTLQLPLWETGQVASRARDGATCPAGRPGRAGRRCGCCRSAAGCLRGHLYGKRSTAACHRHPTARLPVDTRAMQSSSPASQHRRRGRPSKGDRHATMVKLPIELHREVLALAEAEGLPLGDYLTRVVAEAHGHTAPAYCYPAPTAQEELPIARAS